MRSASYGNILSGHLQVLHIYVLLVAPLGVGHIAQPGTDQHKGRVTVRETAHHAGAVADLPIHPFYGIIGSDAVPVFTGKIAVGQCFLDTVLYLLGGRLGFIERSSATTALAFFLAALLLSWTWIALSILATSFTLERGVTENTLRQKWTVHTAGICPQETLRLRLPDFQTLISDNKLHTIQTTASEPLEEIHLTGLVFFHSLGSAPELHGIRPHLLQFKPKLRHFHTLHSSCAAGRCHLHTRIRCPFRRLCDYFSSEFWIFRRMVSVSHIGGCEASIRNFRIIGSLGVQIHAMGHGFSDIRQESRCALPDS